MTVTGDRLNKILKERGIEQTALADAIGIQQGSISKIVNGTTKNSRHLPRIASESGISVDYLLGKSDSPHEASESEPVRPIQLVSMQVALPSERALTRMFDAMLEILDAFPDNPGRDERARLLAQWLPIGLSQLRDLIPHSDPAPEPDSGKELAEALATGARRSRS